MAWIVERSSRKELPTTRPSTSAATPWNPGLLMRAFMLFVAAATDGKSWGNPWRSASVANASYRMRPHSCVSAGTAARNVTLIPWLR